MFEITDEFLAQAGFTTLSDEQKEALKAQVTQSVQRKIGDKIVGQVGEERAEELSTLMDGDLEKSKAVLEGINTKYRESEEFKAIEELGKASNASDDDILKEYAVLAWMKHQGIEIAAVIQEAMNEAMTELSAIYQQAVEAVNRRDNE